MGAIEVAGPTAPVCPRELLMRSFASVAGMGRACAVAAVLGFALVVAPIAQAQATADYPNRPITLIVPYPPAGGVDAMARVVAQKLSEAFKQQVIVDNRGGA